MRSVLLATALIAFCGPVQAQPIDADAMMAQMEASQAQAQAAAQRPGDEALTCDQLQAEFITTMNDPQFRASIAENGALAQGQMDRAQAARGQMMAMMGTGMALGIASAFVPGLGYAQGAIMRAQSAGMQRQADQNMQGMVAQAGNAQAMMPTAYRGQRLYELGAAKQCPFVQAMATQAGAQGADQE